MKSISLLSGYIFLTLAILSGIFSNSFLKVTDGFTKLGPTLFCIANMFVCIFSFVFVFDTLFDLC